MKVLIIKKRESKKKTQNKFFFNFSSHSQNLKHQREIKILPIDSQLNFKLNFFYIFANPVSVNCTCKFACDELNAQIVLLLRIRVNSSSMHFGLQDFHEHISKISFGKSQIYNEVLQKKVRVVIVSMVYTCSLSCYTCSTCSLSFRNYKLFVQNQMNRMAW